MKKVVISGGSGLVGSALTSLLMTRGYEVVHLSRTAGVQDGIRAYVCNYKTDEINSDAFANAHAIIHLAGAGIADKRWTDDRKREIIDSRVKTAELILKGVKQAGSSPAVFVSASGINYYGSKTVAHIFVESDPPDESFIGKCCVEWEAAADEFSGVARVVKLRTGVVFGVKGSALQKIAGPIRFGLGAPLGSGNQYMPYIHLHDLVHMYLYAIENPGMKGAWNATNGDFITNKELTRAVAKKQNKPLWLPNVPAFALKVALGELSEILLEGSRASADKIKKFGFRFTFPDLNTSLEDIYN